MDALQVFPSGSVAMADPVASWPLPCSGGAGHDYPCLQSGRGENNRPRARRHGGRPLADTIHLRPAVPRATSSAVLDSGTLRRSHRSCVTVVIAHPAPLLL